MSQSHDEFFQAYVDCMLWSTCCEDGTPLDERFFIDDIDDKDMKEMLGDCEDFLLQCDHLIIEDNLTKKPHNQSVHEQAGQDFSLTRNGHGAGFWDGDWEEPAASTLTDKSKEYGSFD